MKTLVAIAVFALIGTTGASAYKAAVTPRQFKALQHRVSVLEKTVQRQNGRIAIAEALANAASSSSTPPQTSTTPAALTCLVNQWDNALEWVPADVFAVNGTKYNASGGFGNYAMLFVDHTRFYRC